MAAVLLQYLRKWFVSRLYSLSVLASLHHGFPDESHSIKSMGRVYHSACFTCRACNVQLFEGSGGEGAFQFDNELYCHKHALEKTKQATAVSSSKQVVLSLSLSSSL